MKGRAARSATRARGTGRPVADVEMTMRRLASSALLVLFFVGMAACSSDDSETGVTAGDADATTTVAPGTPTSPPTDPAGDASTSTTTAGSGGGKSTTTTTATKSSTTQSEVLLQVRTGGGFVPVETMFGLVAEFTLLADGQVVVVGPTTLEYPGPALPNLLTATLDGAAVQSAVDAATKAGVGQKHDFGNLQVADAPTTTFLLRKDGRPVTTDVYALGFDDAPMLTAAQRENRRRFAELVEKLQQAGAAATKAYRANAVSVLVTPYPEPSPGAPAAEPAPGTAPWPLGDLAAGGSEQFGGRCLSFTGTEAARVVDAAGEGRSNTRWTSGGKAWSLTFRPELPGTSPCAAGR